MEKVLPAIRCPVLLLQADPGAGGVMSDDDVARATALLAQPHHVRLPNTDHHLFHRKEPALQALDAFLERLWGSTLGPERCMVAQYRCEG